MKALLVLFLMLLAVVKPVCAQDITTTAREAFLFDMTNNTPLFEKNAEEKMPTSSMSKMMTVYMLFSALKSGKHSLADEFTVSEKAWRMPGSRSFANVGSKVKIEDLIRGLIIQSGNDAAVVVAEGLAGSEENFVAQMNAKADEIQMKGSHFANASGMPEPEHYSTAKDMAVLAQRLIEDFPDYYHYFAEKEFTLNNIKQGNRNPLLYCDLGVDGLKTGHADEAGYALTASAVRDGRRLILVVNGLKDMQERADESSRLLEIGYAQFKPLAPYKTDEVVGSVPVLYGKLKTLNASLEKEVRVVAHISKAASVSFQTEFKPALEAPVAKGTEIGTLKAVQDGAVLAAFPLVAADHVERLEFFPLMIEKIRFMMTGKHGE